MIPGLGRSPEEGKAILSLPKILWYFGLENFMDYAVHGVSKSRQTQLNDFHFLHNHIYVAVVKFISILLKAKLIVLIYPIIFTKKYTCFLLKKNCICTIMSKYPTNNMYGVSVQFSSVQSLSHVRLFVTP